MRRSIILAAIAGTLACTLVACSSPKPPRGVRVVEPFDASRYLGRWYEIARLENRFERGLERVTATYSLNDNGTIAVVNQGYDPSSAKWQRSEGTARFTGSPQRAALKVSFFGPFYGGYNVIALDKDYRHALVCGPDRSYLWILSRTPTIDDATRQHLLQQARLQGFDVDKLLWVRQQNQ
ncbi:lipoprotein [Salmonella enterica subsp. enterica serovar Choleraesuis]|nr:lipoprotein [Salmonella enterica subsp. enterica serovar Choleraesuis]